jgi:fatty acid desaturase
MSFHPAYMRQDSPTAQPFTIPSKLNSTIVAAQLAAIGSCFYAAAHIHTWWLLLLLALIFGVVMNSVYSIVHEAEHAMLFSGRRLNDVAGSLMALFFPAPFHLIRQGHLGHHLRNRSDDEAFDFYFEEDHKLWKVLVWYGILTGLYWVIVVLSNIVFLFFPFALNQKYWQVDQASTAFMKSLNPHYRRIIQLECAAAITLHVMVVWLFKIPVLNYLVMYAGFGFMWSAMQYVHHYGTERHVTRGARNLWIWGPVDILWLNHNWHLAHHQHPSVPWIHLSNLDKAESSHRGFLILAYLKMWRGPRLAKERIENKHTQTIIP